MENRAFAEEIHDFLKANDERGIYTDSSEEKNIEEIQSFLSDLSMVKETIKDIEEIADEWGDHEVYVADVKPLLKGLREIQETLEEKAHIRMVGDSGYIVIHAIRIGDKEILLAEDKKAENGMHWLVGNYTENGIIGQYYECLAGDDYLEMMQEFTKRIDGQITIMKEEISKLDMGQDVFTSEHCFPNDYSESIADKIVAIKADVFRPEYMRGDMQLVLVTRGNGTGANPRGNAVYCLHLNNGKHTRFERYDVQGEVKPEHLPDWAKKKAAEIQAEKGKKDRGDAR